MKTPDRYLELQRIWRENHREEIRAKAKKKYKESHPNVRTRSIFCFVCKDQLRLPKSSYCKLCRLETVKQYRKNNLDRHKANARSWRKKNPEKQRDYELRRAHGVSKADYFRILAEQGGVCLICKRTPKSGRVLQIRTIQVKSSVRRFYTLPNPPLCTIPG